MLKIYEKNDCDKWNECVKSFANWDIYYLYEYAYSMMLHGDGKMQLIYFEYENDRLCYVVMKRDIADNIYFNERLEKNRYYDWETPYGYGGPLVDNQISKESQELFKKELYEYCQNNRIVSQFVRFHPMLGNYNVISDVIEKRYMRHTIYIDTTDKERLMINMESSCRNHIRKAIKRGLEVVIEDINNYQDFINIYLETMKHNNADEYYMFDEEYFRYQRNLFSNSTFFYVLLNHNIISGALVYWNDRYCHYHLGGTLTEYRNQYASNLLFYSIAEWANSKGLTKLHLGGGMQEEDSLFRFKKQFNKEGYLDFYVGRTIFNRQVYDELLKIRKIRDETFDTNNNFMIQYRR